MRLFSFLLQWTVPHIIIIWSLLPLKSAKPLIGVFYQLSVHESVSWFKVNISVNEHISNDFEICSQVISQHISYHVEQKEKKHVFDFRHYKFEKYFF